MIFRTLAGAVGLAASLAVVGPAAAQSAAYAAVDDRVVAQQNVPVDLPVLANDFGTVAAGTLSLPVAPEHGTATLRNDVSPAYIEYAPDADYGGEDRLTYRFCATVSGGTACDEGEVTVAIRPMLDQDYQVPGTSGARASLVPNLRALPAAGFAATPLVAPQRMAFSNGTDPTPWTPWDSPAGTTWDLRTLPAPAAGESETRVLIERVDEAVGRGQALVLGIDTDGDGEPSVDEIGCFTATVLSRCELRVPRTPGASTNYWVLVHNLSNFSDAGEVDLYAVPMTATDGTLVATGPGHVERFESFELLVAHRDDTTVDGANRAGIVTVSAQPGVEAGWFPVFVRVRGAGGGASVHRPVPLAQGVPHAFALAASDSHDSTFVDVPPGTTQLRVSSASDDEIELYLVPPSVSNDPTDVAVPAGDLADATVSSVGPGGDELAVANAPAPGRWYAIAVNESGAIAGYTLTAEIVATAPVVRSGSYFNPDRPGSGLFVYPAGSQWTGVWYAFLEDGTPTWYYLQAPQPGGDGIWSSPIFRSAWDGDSNRLTAVGTAVMTPTGADRFRFSYRLDGVAGSQAYESFGRGCPAGGAVDVSSTWFDPDRAGTGYSVQMFPDYEFYAAYFYDGQGVARFVAAELDRFGNQSEELVVRQVEGDCPTCAWTGPPQRTAIGVLQRRFLLGTFDYIYTDLSYAPPVDGEWTAMDYVQLLGGPDSTQGCAL
jgi:hypothetical protein